MSKKIIGLIAPIGAGKDFTSAKLYERLAYPSRQVKFAESLNVAVSGILGVSVEKLQDRRFKEVKQFSFDKTGKLYSSRDVQKIVGSNFRKELGELVFVNALANMYSVSDDTLIISDLRYENELEWVRDNGGIVVYIDNEKAAQVQKSREMHDSVHYPPESEHLMWNVCNRAVDVDYRLDNNDFRNEEPFDAFVQFVLKYLEN